MKLFFTTLVLFIFIQVGFSQDTDTKIKLSLDSGSIDQQFEFLDKKSDSYQSYKLIKKNQFKKIRAHVKDSLVAMRKELKLSATSLATQKKEYQTLHNELNQANTNLNSVSQSKDSISFIGMSLSKTAFKTLFWSSILLLGLVLSFFIYSYRNSNKITKETLSNFAELEEEFTNSKSRALEREQVLNRKLQDELNKSK